jgi:outer membrane protein TolC
MILRPVLACCAVLAAAGCSVQPEPLTDVQLTSYANDKRSRVTADQEPLNGPVTLADAMARALKYNLDKEIEVMQLMLAEQQLRLSHYSLLPAAATNAGFADRNNYSGGSSVRLLTPTGTGEQSLTSSTSSDRDVRTSDIRFSWHILDFGLSYVRAKQAADRVLIAEETRRRVVNRLLESTRAAYWRAVAATRLMHRLKSLDARVKNALANASGLVAAGDSSPLTALTLERELVEIQREIRKLAGELSGARAQFAALLNLDPGKPFEIAIPRKLAPPGHPNLSAEQMIELALTQRSELREVAYQQRINARDAEAALIEMLPGISFDAAPSWNSNQFLFNNHWVSWGAQASWNLLKVFSYPDRRLEIDAKDALLDARARAVTMAIMTQVHVSRARLYHAHRDFRSADRYYDVQRRIVRQIQSAFAAGKVSEQTAIREELNAIVATVKRDMSFAELQSAAAMVGAAVGQLPSADIDYKRLSLSDVRHAVTGSVAAHAR